MKTLSTINTTFPAFFDDTFLRDAFFNEKLENINPLSSVLSGNEVDILAEPVSDIHPFMLNKRNEYVLEIPVPGFSKKEISLEVEENRLHVKAEKNDKQYGETRTMHKEYSFVLPQDIEQNKVTAKCENGLLTVTIEKDKGKKPVIIPVNGTMVEADKKSMWDSLVRKVRKIVSF